MAVPRPTPPAWRTGRRRLTRRLWTATPAVCCPPLCCPPRPLPPAAAARCRCRHGRSLPPPPPPLPAWRIITIIDVSYVLIDCREEVGRSEFCHLREEVFSPQAHLLDLQFTAREASPTVAYVDNCLPYRLGQPVAGLSPSLMTGCDTASATPFFCSPRGALLASQSSPRAPRVRRLCSQHRSLGRVRGPSRRRLAPRRVRVIHACARCARASAAPPPLRGAGAPPRGCRWNLVDPPAGCGGGRAEGGAAAAVGSRLCLSIRR